MSSTVTMQEATGLKAADASGSWWTGLRRHLSPSLVLAFIFIALIIVSSVAPSLLASQNPYTLHTADVLRPPSALHWFGTDYLGRDVFSRVVHGTGLSVLAALIAVVIGLVVGSLAGLISGAWPGRLVDSLLMRITDTLLATPGLLLAMVIVVALGFSTIHAAIAVGVSAIATFARLMRSEVLRISKLPYLESAALVGTRKRALIIAHILPNVYGKVSALSALQLGSALLWISSLAFLGFGASPPSPEWGVEVAESQNYINVAPWMAAFPCLVIVLTVLAFNRLSTFVKELTDDE
jgi:peptide/nickel transport system permease protein